MQEFWALLTTYPVKELFACFGVYLAFIFVFAIVYYRFYKYRPRSFLFHADVETSQKNIFVERTRAKIENTIVQIEVLRNLTDQLSEDIKLDQITGKRFALTSGNQYSISEDFERDETTGGAVFYQIEIYDSAGNLLGFGPRISAHYPGDKVRLFKRWITEHENDLNNMRRDVVAAYGEDARIWKFWDFVYFSTIVQTTVGLGDILPNRTAVRMLVILQILVGYVILVVLLNSILSKG